MGQHQSNVEHSHEDHKSHKKEYIYIFVILGILTIIEIWMADLPLSKMAKGSGLTALALGKALIVAYYYMHLKQETKWVKFIAVLPVMAAVYATVLCLEVIYKPF